MRFKRALVLLALGAPALASTFLALEVLKLRGASEANPIYHALKRAGLRHLFYPLSAGIVLAYGLALELLSLAVTRLPRWARPVALGAVTSLYNSLAVLLALDSVHDLVAVAWLALSTPQLAVCLRVLSRVVLGGLPSVMPAMLAVGFVAAARTHSAWAKLRASELPSALREAERNKGVSVQRPHHKSLTHRLHHPST